MLTFDENGYLFPYELIPASLSSIENHFLFNDRRRSLYHSFHSFLLELNNLGITEYTIWINGSFTTLKKYPKDIDLVAFIPYQEHKTNKSKLLFIQEKYEKTMDIFFEKDFPERHPKHQNTVDDKEYWLNLFCFDRKGFSKGILEIKHTK